MALGELFIGNDYDAFYSLNLPWQQWMNSSVDIGNLEGIQLWLGRYKDYLVAYQQRLQQSGNVNMSQDILSLLKIFPGNFEDKTVAEIVNQNEDFFRQFAKFVSSIQYNAINREFNNVAPGYRTIVKWVKDRMVQEIYARIRHVANQNATMNAAH